MKLLACRIIPTLEVRKPSLPVPSSNLSLLPSLFNVLEKCTVLHYCREKYLITFLSLVWLRIGFALRFSLPFCHWTWKCTLRWSGTGHFPGFLLLPPQPSVCWCTLIRNGFAAFKDICTQHGDEES